MVDEVVGVAGELGVGETRLVEVVEDLVCGGRVVGVGLERLQEDGLDARDLFGVVCRGKGL